MSTVDFSYNTRLFDQEYVFTLSHIDEKSPIPGCEKVYTATIKKTNGLGNHWKSKRIESAKLLEKIKSGFRKEYGLDVILEPHETDKLELKITHPMLETNDSVVLELQEIGEKTLIEQRINYIENIITDQVYPITRDMLGPVILVHPDANLPISLCKEYFEAIIKGETTLQMKSLTDNPQFRFNLAQGINRFYDVKYHFTKEKIIPAKNQFIVDGFIMQGAVFCKNVNTYTVFTRKYNDDVIGVIMRTKTGITIHMAIYQDPTFKIINKSVQTSDGKTTTQTCCTEKDFMDYKYICILPFHMDPGVYYGDGCGGFLLVQNQKLYPRIDQMVDDNIRINNDIYTYISIPFNRSAT